MPAETLASPPSRRWPAVLGAVLTAAMIVGLGRQLFESGLRGLLAAVPTNPFYYLAFAGLYLASPVGDYVIFRRLWGVPVAALAALIRKRIANEVVFGYSGDAYFYAWARANARRHAIVAPFGAVKDVTILSAIAGNAVTLAMIAGALPFAYRVMSTGQAHGLTGSAALVCVTSLPFLIFRRRVFSLAAPTLRWVFGVHLLRIVAGSLFVAFAWSAALPGIAAGIWLLLAAGRMLVSRLPFVPNKDLLFANFAILLIGRNDALVATIAFTAALTLLLHVILIAGFALVALLRPVADRA
ncbi:MAG: hypothetical protein V4659_05300 [Pseudomonadota bacterium]